MSDSMTAMSSATVRPAAVAGYFYPAEAGNLSAALMTLLAGGAPADERPKALIVPHAGYVYSGIVAGRAYAKIAHAAEPIRRVVLLGPTHRVYVRGIAVPTTTHFATPLGTILLDRAGIEGISDLPYIVANDEAHAMEHSLEVQLPFLQRVAPDAMLLPLAVGDVPVNAIAAVLERLWDAPGTLFVISSDLSHYHSYGEARRLDAASAAAIERFAGGELGPEDACGCLPIAGLLTVARSRGLRIERVDLRNSGDTAGPRDRVVGYGSWALYQDK